ncbi:MAG: hypothetical protein AB2792_20685 [Candidatus Thiodiazotropha sp.]
MIFPNWQGSLGVPTVGDSITTKYEIYFESKETDRKQPLMYIQPRSLDGILTERGEDIRDLLQYNHTLTENLLEQYLASKTSLAISANLKGNLKNVLENYRSLLEYVSHYMADYCYPKPSVEKIQFPVANKNDTEGSFSRKIDKWYPGLGDEKPKVKEFLISQQHFSGEYWLNDLTVLSNANKHRALSRPVLNEFESTLVYFQGAGVRLGHMGLSYVKIEEEGALKFIGGNGEEAFIGGPCLLTVNNIPEKALDPGIIVKKESSLMHHIEGTSSSLAQTIWVISKNVYRTVSSICGRLS